MTVTGPKRTGTKLVAGLAASLLLSATLAACGSSGGDGSTSGGSSSGGGGGGGTSLTIALGAEPGTLDGLTLEDSNAAKFNRNVVQTLTTRDDSGRELEPQLATSWENRGNRWIFHLRRGVRFHDGSPMTSEDVVASYEKVLDPDVGSTLTASVPSLKRVRAIDDETVEMVTDGPSPTIPAAAAMIDIVPSDWAARGDRRANDRLMGTGPYRFVDWRKGQQIDLTRNDDYWGDKPKWEKVRIVFRPEESVRVNSLQAGEVDVAADLTPDIAVQAPKTVEAPRSLVFGLRLKTSVGGKPAGPLQDPKLREAVSIAIDRQSLVDNILGGAGAVPRGQNVIPQVTGFDPELEDDPYDPERAKQLVAESDGGSHTLVANMPNGLTAGDVAISKAIVQMLTEAGFKVKASYNESAAYHEGALAPSEQPDNPDATPDLSLSGNSNEMFDSVRTLKGVSCTGSTSAGCDPELDRLVEQSDRELDEGKRLEMLHQAWRKLKEDRFKIPIAALDQVHGVAEGIEWSPRPDQYMLFDEIERTG